MKPLIKYIVIPIGSILALGLVIYLGIIFSFVDSFAKDIKLDTDVANRLCKDFIAYELIYSMDDATRCSKYLNNVRIDLNQFSNSDSTCNAGASSFEEVLNQFNISESVYLDFRKRLEKSKLRSYHYEYEMQIFIVDGFLDSIWGYAYSENKLEVNTERYFKLSNSYSIIIVEDLGDNWYRIGGT